MLKLPDMDIRKLAAKRHKAAPGICYQRHITDLYAELEPRIRIASLDGATVEPISRDMASHFVTRYEWLGTLGRVTASYGLMLGGELLGVAAFGIMGGHAANVCGAKYARKTVCLQRGACVHFAPRNSATFLISRACKIAARDFGWRIFFAYADDRASELGTVYQAANWLYLGMGAGYSRHYNYHKGTRTITSYQINHGGAKFMQTLGWKSGPKRPWLRAHGWKQTIEHGKHKYVHFEGTRAEQKAMRAALRYEVLPYPKRISEVTNADAV